MKRLSTRVQSPESRVQSQQAAWISPTLRSPPSALDCRRTAATLSEILISILVMSIGVVSLATLFPISVLRSIQASQLTNATIHRLNAEELLGLFPRLVHDPDADGNLAEHEIQNSLGGQDNPDHSNDFKNEGRFIVDPIGWNTFNNPAAPQLPLLPVRDHFGNNNGAVVADPIRRYHGGFQAAAAAQQLSFLGDTWQLAGKGVSTGSSSTSLDVPTNTDLVTFAGALAQHANGVRVRIIAFSPTGKQSAVRNHEPLAKPLTITGQTISWVDPLPWPVSSRFRLEIYDARYSWLLTVRNSPSVITPTNTNPGGRGNSSVDVVVFHRRAITAITEQLFRVSSWTLPDQCTLDLTVAPAGAKPLLKPGGFIFDAKNARWYRISQLNENGTAPTIKLDRPLVYGVNPTTLSPSLPDYITAMPGIVDVFTLDGSETAYRPENAP